MDEELEQKIKEAINLQKLKEAINLHELGKINKAEKIYQELLGEMPNNELLLGGLSLVCITKNKFNFAKEYINRAIQINPTAVYYTTLGNIYHKKRKSKEAQEFFLHALDLEPDNFQAMFNLGVSYLSEYEIDQGEMFLNKAMNIEPYNAECYFQLAFVYSVKQETDKAIEYLVKAIELKPNYSEAMFLLSCIFLKLSNFAEGWILYESRFYKRIKGNYNNLIKPEWKGESLLGKTIYIQYEQGLGDSIMFARFIPFLAKMGAKVLFKPQAKLEQLFKDSMLPAEIINYSTPVDSLAFDTQISTMSIPLILKINEKNIPFKDKYLKADPKKVKEYKEKYFNNNDFKIGITWQCKNVYLADRIRSIPDISYLFPIAQIPGVKTYSLQKGKGEAQLKDLPDNVEIIPLGHTFNTFSDTAAAIENLDLMICVDTSVVHLAGALGKETLVLLDYAADWKWLLNRDDSIWYESTKLFRQTELKNWKTVIDDVVKYVKAKNLSLEQI